MRDEKKKLAFFKNSQWYIFQYIPGEEHVVIDALISKAEGPDPEFSFFDVAVLSNMLGVQPQQDAENIIKKGMSTPRS